MASAVSHPVFARAFPAMSRALEAGGMAGRRKDLLAGLGRRGHRHRRRHRTGLRSLPRRRDRVLAVEPEPRLRALATAAARAVPVPVEVTGGTAGALPAADAGYDAAAASFVLCTVPDQDAALAEIRRVLRPGATLCFLEHLRAGTPGLVRVQRLLAATVWPHLLGRCHLSRDTAAAIKRAGFTITTLEHFLFPAARTPVSFHIAGHATAPGR